MVSIIRESMRQLFSLLNIESPTPALLKGREGRFED